MNRSNNFSKSGDKYRTPQGFVAVRDGLTPKRAQRYLDTTEIEVMSNSRKPAWIRAKIPGGKQFHEVNRTVDEHDLNTVCKESHCPNIGECWSAGTATLMLLGSVCTRACRFCAVDTGHPNGWIDELEPDNCARAVQLMNLKYVVLTSVDRDDLPDGGATHYARCIVAISKANTDVTIEALTPDFAGDLNAVSTVVNAPISVFAQNIETVRSLTSLVRDPRAGYQQTLTVLKHAKTIRDISTKSSLMLGLGETDSEIEQTMTDLLKHEVDFLTLGQYLRPTKNHLPVIRWVHPEQFKKYREIGLQLGFKDIAAGPLVRSSYRADRLMNHLDTA